MKRILSIDGGGIRGVFPAAFLAELERDLEQPLHDYFDLIAGTSTGGIIAIGLAMGLRAKEILDLYERRGPEIFSQQSKGMRGWIERKIMEIKRFTWGPKYNTNELECAMKDALGNIKIGEAKTRLMIPAWHPKMNDVYIFKTAHHGRFNTDCKEFARDVAMATASAPTYFHEFITARDVGLVDGGVWANNPTGIAVAEGISTLKWEASEIRVLSLGCLDDVVEMRGSYGALLLAPKLAGLFMAGQSRGSQGLAHILTGDVGGANHKAVFRVSRCVPEGFFALDDTSKIQELKSLGIATARHEKPNLSPVFFSNAVEDQFKPMNRC